MNLRKKKLLTAAALGVGVHRIIFNRERLAEIKEAITKQDIRDLQAGGAIAIREVRGRRTHLLRKNRRRAGSIRHKHRPGKREYVTRTRKLRAYLKEIRKQGKISASHYHTARKYIKASVYRTKAHMKEHIASLAS